MIYHLEDRTINYWPYYSDMLDYAMDPRDKYDREFSAGALMVIDFYECYFMIAEEKYMYYSICLSGYRKNECYIQIADCDIDNTCYRYITLTSANKVIELMSNCNDDNVIFNNMVILDHYLRNFVDRITSYDDEYTKKDVKNAKS